MAKKSYLTQVTGALVAVTLGAAASTSVLAQEQLLAQEQQLASTGMPQPSVEEQRAQQLLQRAVQHIKDEGVMGVNDFNRDARFVDRDLYVFSVNADGVVLASGGWSAAYIGDNVLDMMDENNRPFFREIIEGAKNNTRGVVQYQWYNPADGGMEAKLTSYEMVDDIIVAVGYFPVAPTLEQIYHLLETAVLAYQQDPQLALRKFANRAGEFQFRGLKVLVLDLANQTVLFDAAQRELAGVALVDLVDVTGQPFLLEVAQRAQTDTVQQVEALLLNLKTKRVMLQRIFFKRSGQYVIGIQEHIYKNAQ